MAHLMTVMTLAWHVPSVVPKPFYETAQPTSERSGAVFCCPDSFLALASFCFILEHVHVSNSDCDVCSHYE